MIWPESAPSIVDIPSLPSSYHSRNDVLIKISLNKLSSFLPFVVISKTNLYLYNASPIVLTSAYTRSKESLDLYGDNHSLKCSNDGSLIFVQTSKGFLLIFSILSNFPDFTNYLKNNVNLNFDSHSDSDSDSGYNFHSNAYSDNNNNNSNIDSNKTQNSLNITSNNPHSNDDKDKLEKSSSISNIFSSFIISNDSSLNEIYSIYNTQDQLIQLGLPITQHNNHL
ncbi:uncharacterized protein ASCRUDRAFT_73737, partial [Ascoidea rubescens DSM 1968]